ncbi:hypothetical protein ABIE26_000687 [Pedobacter africanus]|uniref:Uncharacterized protein n=1 Tax=Pedobacter africanus TaxID=151894 RepID=A0ACC6KUB7_9SPHI|nr:RagB/SusD family nutrient uptake outer membrane protein [Pedobacter africanus]MDR6782826.1 hypothetical protein [Pedobacter africanus]
MQKITKKNMPFLKSLLCEIEWSELINKIGRTPILILLINGILFMSSCKKFLEIDSPKDSITPSELFANNEIATSTVTGIYSRIMATTLNPFSGSEQSVGVLAGLSADELKSHNPLHEAFYRNEVPSSSGYIEAVWNNVYSGIYSANSILEGLQSPNGLSDDVRKQLEGEVKFIRAFSYFYLVNLFGDVPLNLTSDYRVNKIASKASKQKIYDQIIADLNDAENLLSSSYVTNERVRPNKWVAKAMLARVYLYLENWDLAAQKAKEVIDQKPTYELMDDLDKIFLKNSKEAIWQLMPNAGSNTRDGAVYVLVSTPANISLSEGLMKIFETGDNRKVKWTGIYTNSTGTYNYPYKYKIRTTTNGIVSEYSMVIRLAELYLIRAEARINNGNVSLGITDLNVIRQRPLPNGTPSNSIPALPLDLNKSDALLALEKERRIELFCEWGHRWLDLKRSGRASTVLSPLKGITWKDTDVLYPLPNAEITGNPNSGQNLGY